MKNRWFFRGLFCVVLFLFMFSCQKAGEAVSETVEGVPVVRNPKEPVAVKGKLARSTLEEELRIGEVEGLEEYMFSRIRGVAVDDLDRIYIVDYQAAHVKVFDDEGNYLKTIGKQGQGPEEFSRPSRVAIANQNFLAVEDMGNRAIKFFNLDGHYSHAFSTANIRMYSRTTFSKQGYILGIATDIDPQNPVYEIRKFDKDFVFQKIIRTCPTPPPSGELNPFHPVFYFQIDRDDNIVYGFPENYEIQILSPEGDVLKRIIKDFDQVEITEEEKEREREGIPDGIRVVFLKHYPPWRLFTVDEEGRIFVQARERFEGQLRYVYEVFDSEGRFRAKFYLEAEPLLWKKDKMYALAEDEEGFQSIKRYRVIWEE